MSHLYFCVKKKLAEASLMGSPANRKICGDKLGVPRELNNSWGDKQTSVIAKIA